MRQKTRPDCPQTLVQILKRMLPMHTCQNGKFARKLVQRRLLLTGGRQSSLDFLRKVWHNTQLGRLLIIKSECQQLCLIILAADKGEAGWARWPRQPRGGHSHHRHTCNTQR